MRVFRFVLPVICALSLSACSGTFEGMGNDFTRLKQAASPTSAPLDSSKPVVIEEPKPFPEAYYGQNPHGIVLKPPGVSAQAVVPEASVASVSSGGPVWHQLDNYDPGNFTPQGGNVTVVGDAAPAMQQGRDYNDAVKVFSLDGDPGAGMAYNQAAADYGRFSQQVFFPNGSSAVKPGDRKKLHSLAKRAKNHGPEVAVTVVGHASHRVARSVKDPIRKKMINFAMAQKRAAAVTRELKLAGMQPSWVQSVSKGDDEPNPNPMGMTQEAADRRAEVYVDER